MTTSIKVSAHCATNKEVEVTCGDVKQVLQDGEKFDTVIYDDLCCSVREVKSSDPSPQSGGTGGDRPPPDND
ncbi:MAG: hypothetical protein JKX85_00895 [Phycisphaeraceae bacterium]|nr:hypothetical protein [Phycisphaeraceae bacterium]